MWQFYSSLVAIKEQSDSREFGTGTMSKESTIEAPTKEPTISVKNVRSWHIFALFSLFPFIMLVHHAIRQYAVRSASRHDNEADLLT